jgi:multidrug resistance protein MdtO
LFAPDAFTNSDHLKFAFRACLASIACYIVYSAIAWPGLSSAVATCLFTALSTVGASHQKQILRLVGAILGGLILGIGSQILVFPSIDSISAFALVFGLVSTIAAWIMTATPRLSYLGFQAAYAFYLIHLQSFHFETSLTTARDRIVGVGMGLTAMWLIFDRFWSAPQSLLMKRALARSFRLLAKLTRGPASKREADAIEECSALRETIYSTFDQTRSLSDGMLFEFGPGRAEALELRELVRHLQPQLRSLFVLRVSALDYRLRLPGFELPQDTLTAQILFDECSAGVLQELADAIETGRPRHSSLRPCLAAFRTEKLNP